LLILKELMLINQWRNKVKSLLNFNFTSILSGFPEKYLNWHQYQDRQAGFL